MKEKLNRYHELLEEIELLKSEQAEKIQAATPEELQAELDDAQQALARILEKVDEATAEVINKYEFDLFGMGSAAASLLADIKDETLEAGETLRGDHLMAVYTKGRATWNSKGLDGFSVAYPDILKFKKTGAPSVSIRKIT